VKTRIVLLGPPAAGKGTQAEKIAANFGILTASTGAMLRAEKAAGTELGQMASELTSRGQLLSDDLVIGLVKNWLKSNEGGFLFDGFPRTIVQANALDDLLSKAGKPLQVAISLETSLETIEFRVGHRLVCTQCSANFSLGLHVTDESNACPNCGGTLKRRLDDNAEALKQRMVEYHQKSEPLIAYYAERGLLKRIEANGSPDEVFVKVKEVLNEE
jgi:adenylate kinase